MKKFLWLIVLLCGVGTLQAQGGGGVLVTSPNEEWNLNPLFCTAENPLCNAVGQVLFPVLYGSEGQPILLNEWEASDDGLTYTITLQKNLLWNDGTPITAYDVFYTYLALRSGDFASPYREQLQAIDFLLPTDEFSLIVQLKEPQCDVLRALSLPILPAHVYDPTFRANLPAFDALGDYATQFDEWWTVAKLDFQYLGNHPANYVPNVTIGGTKIHYARYWGVEVAVGEDNVGVFIANAVSSENAEDRIITTGSVDVLLNPTYDRWQDILASDAHTLIYPENVVYYLGFNFANPLRPRSAIDPVDNQPLEQGNHPILADERVREALRLGIDVHELIAVALQGYGERVNSLYPLLSDFYSDEIPLTDYDPIAARRLLEDAGWKLAVAQRGERSCVECQFARPNTSLTLSLVYPQTPITEAVVTVLARQLRFIGVNLNLEGVAPDSLLSTAQAQRYDLLLNILDYGFPIHTTRFDEMFVKDNDRVGSGTNTASYYNAELETLLADARTQPQCTAAERQAEYTQIQQILHEEKVIIPLFAPQAMTVLRGYVLNAEPKPYQPFWNLADWSVFYGN